MSRSFCFEPGESRKKSGTDLQRRSREPPFSPAHSIVACKIEHLVPPWMRPYWLEQSLCVRQELNVIRGTDIPLIVFNAREDEFEVLRGNQS